jgi:hypothetical protein
MMNGMMTYLRALLLTLLLGASIVFSGCAAFRGRTPDRTLTAELPISRSEAVRRTMTAFREQGYPMRASLTSGVGPESLPFRMDDDAEAVFRAAIAGSARGAQVVLSGTYRRLRLMGTVRGDEHEVQNSDDPLEHALWTRLDQLRLAIQLAVR